jgi:CelD/BcsL family acetyltransferase involved in cellulose biosynthesis
MAQMTRWSVATRVDAVAGAVWDGFAPAVFQSPAWTAALAASGLARDLRLLTLRDHDGAVAALLPLAIVRRRGARVLEWAGAAVTDRCVPLVDPALAADPRFWAEARQEIMRQPADIVELAQMPAESPAVALLDGLAPMPPVDCPTIDCRMTPEAFLAGRGANHRAKVQRQGRRLAKLGAVAFRALDEPGERLALAEFILARKRATHRIADEVAAFVRATASIPSVAYHALTAGGELVAAHVGMTEGDRALYWLPAYDPGFASYAPGHLLVWRLWHAARDAGAVELDLLRGSESYKDAWATGRRRLLGGFAPLTVRGRAWLLARRVARGLRSADPAGERQPQAPSGISAPDR